MAFTHVHITLQHLGLSDEQAMLFDRLASRVFGSDASCISPADLAAEQRSVSRTCGDTASPAICRSCCFASRRGRRCRSRASCSTRRSTGASKGLRADVVILNEHPADYLDEMQSLCPVSCRSRLGGLAREAGGHVPAAADGMPESDRRLLSAVARVVLLGDLGDLVSQLERPAPWLYDEHDVPRSADARRAAARRHTGHGPAAGHGKRARRLHARRPRVRRRARWRTRDAAAVVERAGESRVRHDREQLGSAFTWAGNSRENRLTPFANDPLTDPTGKPSTCGTTTRARCGARHRAAAAASRCGRWVIRHGAGVTRYQHAVAGIEQELAVFVAPEDPVKLAVLTLTKPAASRGASACSATSSGASDRRAPASAASSSRRWTTRPECCWRATPTTRSSATRRVLARDDDTAIAHGDRAEFVGRNRTLSAPAALFRDELAGRTGAGLDPCGACSSCSRSSRANRAAWRSSSDRDAIGCMRSSWPRAILAPGAGGAHARRGRARVGRDAGRRAGPHARRFVRSHRESLAALPDIGCRVWARSGPYQPGGAFGFRDQLQDVLALIYTRPDLCRAHLLHAASRQFVEGDVQHWWHPPSGRGTERAAPTICSGCPMCRRQLRVADRRRLGARRRGPFLEAPPLEPDQSETYMLPRVVVENRRRCSSTRVRAIAHAMKYGAHGLPLMGSGDWNDGMNRVGHAGRGESVWLGWFLVTVLNEFAPICERRGRSDLAQAYRDEARWLTGMLELAWDGDWYRRAYFDDGTPLGSVQNEECKLDSLTQSWAVLRGGAAAAPSAP